MRLAEVAASRAATSARCASSSNTPCMLTSPAHSRVAATSATTRSSSSNVPVGGAGNGTPNTSARPHASRNTSTIAVLTQIARVPAQARAITGITANHTRPGELSPPLASDTVTATAPTSHRPARATRSVSPRRHSQAVAPRPASAPSTSGAAARHPFSGSSASSKPARANAYAQTIVVWNTITRARRRTIGSPRCSVTGTSRSTNATQPRALRANSAIAPRFPPRQPHRSDRAKP